MVNLRIGALSLWNKLGAVSRDSQKLTWDQYKSKSKNPFHFVWIKAVFKNFATKNGNWVFSTYVYFVLSVAFFNVRKDFIFAEIVKMNEILNFVWHYDQRNSRSYAQTKTRKFPLYLSKEK